MSRVHRASPQVPDPKALKILRETYWGPSGWKPAWNDPKTPEASPEDYDYAIERGVMFRPIELSHDEAVEQAIDLGGRVDLPMAADAFLASLTTRRLELRSALGSLHVARSMPAHRFAVSRRSPGSCEVCGAGGQERVTVDLNVLNFERFQWGGVRHLHPEYVAFDLARFLELHPVEPTPADVAVANELFSRLLQPLEPTATASILEKRLQGLFPSSSPERRVLIQILGYSGIVQPSSVPSLRERWTNKLARPPVPGRNDWSFPVYAWRGRDGIDASQITRVFPQLRRRNRRRLS
jgi:hypothetical protein